MLTCDILTGNPPWDAPIIWSKPLKYNYIHIFNAKIIIINYMYKHFSTTKILKCCILIIIFIYYILKFAKKNIKI